MPGRSGSSRCRLIPDHDTPEVLRKHAQMRGAAPPLWTYAVASHAELAKIAAPLGLFYAPGEREIAHNLCTVVIDPDGKLARLDLGRERNNWTASDLLKTVYALLPAPRARQSEHLKSHQSLGSVAANTFATWTCASMLIWPWRLQAWPCGMIEQV